MEIEVKGRYILVQAIEVYKESRWIRVASIIVGGKETGTHFKGG
jgi:hypothetical protein